MSCADSSPYSSFAIITSTGSTGLSTEENFNLALGDGASTFVWHWEDHDKSGIISSDELYPVVLLNGFNNDSLNGSELVYETISGV